MTTAADAIAQLAADNANGLVLSLNQLRALAASVSAATTNPDGNGVLCSGVLPDGIYAYNIAPSVARSVGYGTIDETGRAALLKSVDFQTTLQSTLASNGLTGAALDNAINQTLNAPGLTGVYDRGLSFWAAASTEFAASLYGNIMILATNASKDSILFMNQLPATLNAHPTGRVINGIARSDLIAKKINAPSAAAWRYGDALFTDYRPSGQDYPQPASSSQSLLHPATAALLSVIEEKRKTDPLIAAKISGKDIFQWVLKSMKTERGAHVESLLCALGALAGYSCQASLRDQAIGKGLEETAALIIFEEKNGKKYFFGDPLNHALCESKFSVWSLAAGAAQHHGCKNLPDFRGIFEHVAKTVGKTDTFGVPRLPEGHNVGALPIAYLKAMWPVLFPNVRMFCKDPAEWPLSFGFAIQEAIAAGKQVISPELALLIVMEAAIPMSKVDFATA
jgi:hypothetical protein